MTDIKKKKKKFQRAGRHFGFFKRAGRHEKGAGRCALQKKPRQNTVKARPGSGFYEIFCIFANMSCLCIHLCHIIQLALQKHFCHGINYFMS